MIEPATQELGKFSTEVQTRLARADLFSPFAAFRPPNRISVSEGAATNLYIKQPGGVPGPWNPEETPYMREPMDMLASRGHEAVCFVGPARTGKTAGLLLGWMAHVVVNDPGDMLFVSMTQDKSREFSKTDLDRGIQHSPNLAALMPASGQANNTHDKMFRHGMWLRVAWPTVSNLSGSTYRYVAFTDYDRMPDDIDGEGNGFDLGKKRTQTFLSRGMCLVESSPGREYGDPNWRPATAHEAPPCTGILGIYNRSDRRRWYWPCPECDEYFEAKPGLSLFNLPSDKELLEQVREADLDALAAEYARLVCPHCGSLIEKKHKRTMNMRGVWLTEGQTIGADGVVQGEGAKSSIAGYWLGGVAAAYQSWHSIIMRYLQGLREYALSGSELSLKTTVNTDQGMPYISRALTEGAMDANDPASRCEADLARFIVPENARFIVASVDVQGGQNARFVVQVHAIGEHMEQWLIDRYDITDSRREGVDGGFAPIDPASYPEDWDVITEQVVDATYRLPIEGKELRIKMIAVDTGGEDGVTDKAYDWYRRLRRAGKNGRVMLVKGASTKSAPLIRESWVGKRNSKEQGDIPLYLLNTNLFKDAVAASMRRVEVGPGYMHYPAWLPRSFFDEMTAEVRNADGTWHKVSPRNEAFDLSGYIRAACTRLGADKINWTMPPTWAAPWGMNSDVITREERRRLQADGASPAVAAPRRRTVSRSSYMR